MNFNMNWLYTPHDIQNGHLPELDEMAFSQICLPHANKLLEVHRDLDFQRYIDSLRFVSWYRKHFVSESGWAGKRIAIEFLGVATVAEIYVNGNFVSEHRGAYTSFVVDITEHINPDGDNVLAVRVDSTRHCDLPPEGHNVDYMLFGGIVRDVNLIVTDLLHINWVFCTTPELTAESGILKAEISITNNYSQAVTCTIKTILKDAEGNVVTSIISPDIVIDNHKKTIVENISESIRQPNLWDIDSPYLYKAVTQVLVNGKCVDENETCVGLRFFEFKSSANDANFYLNGKKTKIFGINRHEQWPWIGRAVPAKLQRADADLIKAHGINTVRTSHYPQHPDFLQRCDEIGLMVFEEAPGWQHIGDTAWQDYFIQNIEEMITRDRNHPCIISWGTRPNESPVNGELDKAHEEFFIRANTVSKHLDPTRPTHGARIEFLYEQSELFNEDIYGVNYRYPDVPKYTPFIITEHTMSWGEQGTAGASDELAMKWIDDWAKVLDYIFGNELVAGGFGWSMFDYNNEVNYTKTEHVFPSGLFDIFRHDKPVAWLFKAQKCPSDDVVLYVANYWTHESPERVIVLSNCEEVELFVGDESKGRIKPNRFMNLPHPVFEFSGIKHTNDSLMAVGFIGDKAVKEHVRKTPKEAVALTINADYNTLIANGIDMTCCTVEIVDENGTRLPYADNEITINIEGTATFIGNKTIALEGGRIGFIIQSVLDKPGVIKCKSISPGLADGELIITCKPKHY